MNSSFQKVKAYITRNLLSILLFSLFLFVFFNADARSFVSQQLLKTGLFAPKIEEEKNNLISTADILFRNAAGETYSLKSLEGKVVFINFWATWCPPCVAEMPSIQKLYDEIGKQNIVFLMVDVDNQLKKSQKFMDKKGYTLPVYTPASVIPSNILDGSIPTTLILDKQGRKVLLHSGMGNYADKDLVASLKQLSK
jgi:thiol-disulfide isomerase/thioredoxin